MAEETIMVAKASFMFEDEDDRPVLVGKGATVRVGHPIMVGREDMFEPLHVNYEHDAPTPGRRAAKRASAAPELPLGGDN